MPQIVSVGYRIVPPLRRVMSVSATSLVRCSSPWGDASFGMVEERMCGCLKRLDAEGAFSSLMLTVTLSDAKYASFMVGETCYRMSKIFAAWMKGMTNVDWSKRFYILNGCGERNFSPLRHSRFFAIRPVQCSV